MVGFSSKQNHLMISEDICCLNPQFSTSSVSGEDFFVDQLLNFNDEETSEDTNGDVLFSLDENEAKKNSKVSSFLSPSSPPFETEHNRDDFGSHLSIQAEEADLEWLSQFVEESFSQFPTPYPPGSEPGPESSKGLSKSRRSKRTRSGGRVWSMALTELSSSDPTRIRFKKRVRGSEPGPAQPRRCSHCGVLKTPQWRAGPMGAKTLCNACGVRFKSGRLLPEYRPACSPTFSSTLHSNSHRKVLEMRRKKDVV